MKTLLRTFVFLLPLLPLFAAEEAVTESEPSPDAAWRIDFHEPDVLETQWKFDGSRFLVPRTSFTIKKDPEASNGAVLLVEAKKSTGVLLAAPSPVDLAKTPVMRWRWRVTKPVTVKEGDDEPDDQAVVMYFGDGTLLAQKCVGYRWNVTTPVDTYGITKYAAGVMTVAHRTIRNHNTPTGEWVTEERDVVSDYETAYKKKPNTYFIISVGANSQYSKSHSIAEIDFIEFIPRRTEQTAAK